MTVQADDAGFGLVELLVVVLIVGVLAGIAVPIYLSQRQRGWEAQLTSDVRNSILEVEAAHALGDGSYPIDQAAFDALGVEISSPTITLTYTTNSAHTEFCVLGRDARLPAGHDVAHYVSGSGVKAHESCPPFENP